MASFIEDEAKKVHQAIHNFMGNVTKINPYPDLGKKVVKGYFRTDSYEWTAFKFFINKNKGEYTFKVMHYLQHEGECIRYLKQSNNTTTSA